MENYCALSKEHKCIKWMDYEPTRHELKEADILCHGNWIEIQRQNEYIKLLQWDFLPKGTLISNLIKV
jgi:hypothetical protein